MRDREDSRNLPFYVRSEILKKSKRDVMRNENFSAELRIKEETLLAKNPKEKQLCKESEEETTQEIKGL